MRGPSQPPAIAPTTSSGSAPSATASGSGASGESCERSRSHAKNRTEILSEQPLDEQKLREVIDKTGYELKGITSEPYEKKGLFHR